MILIEVTPWLNLVASWQITLGAIYWLFIQINSFQILKHSFIIKPSRFWQSHINALAFCYLVELSFYCIVNFKGNGKF